MSAAEVQPRVECASQALNGFLSMLRQAKQPVTFEPKELYSLLEPIQCELDSALDELSSA